MIFKIIFLLSIFKSLASSSKVDYYNNDLLDEGDTCEFDDGFHGHCKRLEDCPSEYQNFRGNKRNLKICKFTSEPKDDLICCPIKRNAMKQLIDYTDFEVCKNQFVHFRKIEGKNPTDLARALYLKQRNATKEDCEYIGKYSDSISYDPSIPDLKKIYCDENFEIKTINYATGQGFGGVLVNLGDRTNMAAIGWTQINGEIKYNCGGSILSPRWVITAAHCKFYQSKIADIIRVGDRFLNSVKDDENAQQLSVETFIIHPEYRSSLRYNDIAMIKTDHEITFNEFVSHACIAEVNQFWDTLFSVAGYGETENGTNGDLLEIQTFIVNQTSCNESYAHHDVLPNGIIESQICLKGWLPWKNNTVENYHTFTPDTCYGDSGSPLQNNRAVSIADADYDRTLLKTIYKVPVVTGLVSFGVACGLDFPSVYTRLSFYTDWIRSIIQSN